MENGRADSAAWFDHPMIGTAERYTLLTQTGRFTRVLGRGPRRRLLAALSAAALALQACASPYPSEEERASLGRIGLVSAGFTPEVEVPAPFATTGGGAAVGAAGGVLAGTAVGAVVLLSALSSCLFAPPACPAVLPFIAGGAAAGGVVGAAVGAADESQSEAGRKAFAPIIDEQVAQDALRARVLAYAAEQGLGPFVIIDKPRPKAPDQPPDYRPLAAKGIDIVFEVSLLSLKLERAALLSDEYRPEAAVRARLVRLGDYATTVRDETYYVWGEDDELDVWARDDRQRFRAWIDHAYETLGRYLVDEFFLLWVPRSGLALYLPGLPTSVAKGLRPEYPGLRESSAFCGAIWFPKCPPYTPAHHLFTEIDTLQPTFRWEPFPGAEQQEGEKAPADVREVTYEVKVFSARRSSRTLGGRIRTLGGRMVPELLGGPVYSRIGLVEPSHRIKVPLAACTKYFWTVRAKFRLGGQPRLTDWANLSGTPWHTRRAAYSGFSGERQLADPSYYYLPFQTPCPGTASQ